MAIITESQNRISCNNSTQGDNIKLVHSKPVTKTFSPLFGKSISLKESEPMFGILYAKRWQDSFLIRLVCFTNFIVSLVRFVYFLI